MITKETRLSVENKCALMHAFANALRMVGYKTDTALSYTPRRIVDMLCEQGYNPEAIIAHMNMIAHRDEAEEFCLKLQEMTCQS